MRLVSVAARDARDRPIAILSVCGPAYRILRPRLNELGALLLQAATELEAALS
jgi:DNA-binding IclR family transcriptional regulator